MSLHMEKPACGGRAVPNSDLAGASITSESKSSLVHFQADQLARRCAVGAAMAATLAPFVFGEVRT